MTMTAADAAASFNAFLRQFGWHAVRTSENDWAVTVFQYYERVARLGENAHEGYLVRVDCTRFKALVYAGDLAGNASEFGLNDIQLVEYLDGLEAIAEMAR